MINRHLDPYGYMIPEIFNDEEPAYDPNLPLHIEDECKVWLDGKDAGQFTLDGTYVDDWIGKGSLGVHAANTNADATRPTYDPETGIVTFTAANNTFLQSAAFASELSQPNTVFVVAKYTAHNNNAILVCGAAVEKRHQIYEGSTNFGLYAGIVLADGARNLNNNIHVALFNGVSSEYWINGVSVASGDVGTQNLNGVTLGSHEDIASQFPDAEIMEVIVYNADISDVDRDKITGYLANKWDITATTD